MVNWQGRKGKRMIAGTALFACLFCALPVRAGDWPQFRGPGGSGVSDETGLPVRWGPTQNIRWKIDLPGRGVSSPVVARGRVYVTASSGFSQDRLHVLCFDAASGKELWHRQFWATGHTQTHPKTCVAAPTPVTDGDHVFALFSSCDLAALDSAGSLLWYRALARDYPTVGNHVGMAASPILAQDLLLLAMENAGESFAVAVDLRTGQNRWKIDRQRDINWVTPLLVGNGAGAEVLFQSANEISAYEARTGEKRWTYASTGLATIASPVAGKDLVFVPASGQVLALRPKAEPVTPELAWRSNKLKTSFASPLYYQGRVYTVGSPVGIVTCVAADDGKLLWQTDRLKGAHSASPVAAEGRIYLVNEEGTATVIQTGEKPEILGTSALGETILATPAIAAGAIFLRSDQHLFCIAAKGK